MQAGGHSTPGFPAALTGLSAEDVAERVRNNQTNDIGLTHTRTTGDILRANILTPFNALLGGLLAVILVVGQIQDALFGLVLVANALVGIIQELRAKRSLDRLALLSAPKASILREGQLVQHSIENVVIDDVLELQPGDQVVVDGAVVTSSELEIDESLLTGESDPVAKRGGDEVLSGSFVAAGSGFYRATRVGAKAYARALADEARRFTLSRSELRVGINRVIKLIGWAMLPTAGLLFYSQTQALTGTAAALRGTVAGVVAMVPEGLVLLTSVAFALGVIRLGRQNALVQELPAVETLARVDVICLDKTGTITHGDLSVTGFHTLTGDGDGEDRAALAALASADTSPNSTLLAVRASFPAQDGWKVSDSVAFSSARKWSGATFEARGSWVLGAPDVLLSRCKPAVENEALLRQVDQETASGNRVLLLATSPEILKSDLIPAIVPRALIVLSDRVREEAHDTLRYFHEQGVQVKIISGDHPRTVAIVAGRAGVHGADKAMDARNLTGDEGEMTAALDHHAVFGRVTPQQKRLMIRALQHSGHVVAMTGDGVNDVLALKDADIGIAMGSGASASRAVAKLLLLDGSFAVLPKVVDEGRRVINNVERVANLFLTKDRLFDAAGSWNRTSGASFPVPASPPDTRWKSHDRNSRLLSRTRPQPRTCPFGLRQAHLAVRNPCRRPRSSRHLSCLLRVARHRTGIPCRKQKRGHYRPCCLRTSRTLLHLEVAEGVASAAGGRDDSRPRVVDHSCATFGLLQTGSSPAFSIRINARLSDRGVCTGDHIDSSSESVEAGDQASHKCSAR